MYSTSTTVMCRFCTKQDIYAGGCYATSVMEDGMGEVCTRVARLEAHGSILPCVTKWCQDCKRVSLIMPVSVPATLEYYITLVNWAERMYGSKLRAPSHDAPGEKIEAPMVREGYEKPVFVGIRDLRTRATMLA